MVCSKKRSWQPRYRSSLKQRLSWTVRDVKEELPNIFFTWNFTVRELYSLTPIDGAAGINLNLCAGRIPKENIKVFIEIARECKYLL